MTLPSQLSVELPDGWRCQELTALTVAPDAFSTWLADRGASLALLRPADEALPVAICGGVFVLDVPVPGDVLYSALAAHGEAVALGDPDGIPLVAHLRRDPPDNSRPVATLIFTYFICATSGCVVITFVAPQLGEANRVVREVAEVISAVRVVHSTAGCPVSPWTAEASLVVAVE